MGESRNMDAAIRLREINVAREQIGEEKYLSTDYEIKEAFKYGLCKELVLNNDYQNKLLEAKNIEKAIILTPKLNNLFESLLTDIFTILPFNY